MGRTFGRQPLTTSLHTAGGAATPQGQPLPGLHRAEPITAVFLPPRETHPTVWVEGRWLETERAGLSHRRTRCRRGCRSHFKRKMRHAPKAEEATELRGGNGSPSVGQGRLQSEHNGQREARSPHVQLPGVGNGSTSRPRGPHPQHLQEKISAVHTARRRV